jgi:predicted DNA-binding transcriptional regulator AlpA
MENKGYIREGYKEKQKSHNENESSKAQMFFENLIWGVDEVCSFSGYAKGTIYNLVSRGEIPYRTRGRRKRLVFVPSEIIAWLKGEKT